jgi:CDP-paratose 2-epimerase
MSRYNRDRNLRIADYAPESGRILITGGAGFVGTNLADRLLRAGARVTVLDNLSRPGVERNLRWLRDTHGRRLRIELADVRDRAALQRAVRGVHRVVHLAAQVAVTTSLLDPTYDFEVNALGTLNLLSALNTLDDPPPLLFTSTNKVYGSLADLDLALVGERYGPVDPQIGAAGVGEDRPLDFRSPYGCSKGAADQYVLDYARTFGLKTVVFRMSCVYGPHQFGTEDQGWIAHFLLRALRGEPITLFGDGRQVRDVLFVDDLIDAMLLAFENIDVTCGRAFNIGGGPASAVSLLEVASLIGEICGVEPDIRFDSWRPGDQRYYVSDTTRFSTQTGWRAHTTLADGLVRLRDWLDSTAGVDTAAAAAAGSPPVVQAAAVVGDP